jgi:hypothetical protein
MDKIQHIHFSIKSNEEIIKSTTKKEKVLKKPETAEEYEKYINEIEIDMQQQHNTLTFKKTLQKVLKMMDLKVDLNEEELNVEALFAYAKKKYLKEKL